MNRIVRYCSAWLVGALALLTGCQPPAPPAPPAKHRAAAAAEDVRAKVHPELRRSAVQDERVAQNLREGKEPFAHLMGYRADPAQSERFIRSLEKPTLREASPQLFQARGPPTANEYAAEQPVLLYRAFDIAHQRKFGKPWVPVAQEIGDCTSHGYSNGGNVLLAIDYVQGRSSDFDLIATEATYGLGRVEGAGRTHNGSGDGSNGAAMVAGITKYGVVFRRDYRNVASSECDLRSYSGSRAKNWGTFGCGGRSDQGRLDGVAKQHPILQAALVTTWAETRAAVKNGYPIVVCSSQGFAYATDQDGFAAARGTWPHCMCVVGIRFDREGVLIENSWGPDWIDQSRGKYPSDQPPGTFWCDRRVWERMIAGRDTYAISSLVGFPRQHLLLVEGL